jgi:CheY-like chemotaxis protein
VTERPKSSHEPSSAKEPIVLVVEDDASMRRALSNLFGSVGLVVEHLVRVRNVRGEGYIQRDPGAFQQPTSTSGTQAERADSNEF